LTISAPPAEYFNRMVFDSLTHDGPALEFLGRRVGWDRVVLGSDYAFHMASAEPVGAVRDVGPDAVHDCMPSCPASRSDSCDPSATDQTTGDTMRTSRIGALDVSCLSLGTNNFGRSVDAHGARRIVDAALEVGMTFLDCSDNYGSGAAEGILRAAVAGRRDEVVLASKFGTRRPGVEGSGGAAPDYVRSAIEVSLRELGTDHLDLYFLHMPDPSTPIADTLGAMQELVDAGKVREIACSNLDAAQLDESAEAAAASGLRLFRAMQLEYSLLHRSPEHDGVLAACERHDVGLLPYYPLASGLLTGKQRPGQETGRLTMDRYRGFLTERNYAIVDRLRAFAEKSGRSMVELAIGWLLAQPQVPVVVAGASRPDQVTANAAAAETPLTPEETAEVTRITSPQQKVQA
jgi:aryl-alcohol dehydrogenase-like predicted oxidoreductase